MPVRVPPPLRVSPWLERDFTWGTAFKLLGSDSGLEVLS